MLQMGRLIDDNDDEGLSRYWEFHDRYFAARARSIGLCSRRWYLPRLPTTILSPSTRTPTRTKTEPSRFRTGSDGTRTRPLGGYRETQEPPPTLATSPSSCATSGTRFGTLRVVDSTRRTPASSNVLRHCPAPVPSGSATHSIRSGWQSMMSSASDPGCGGTTRGSTRCSRTFRLSKQLIAGNYPVYGLLISRHARLAWKYEASAHALALKELRVSSPHSIQLGATALGLAMCPIGSRTNRGSSGSPGTRRDEYVPVGEFWLAQPH